MDAPYQYDGLEASSYDWVDELTDFNDFPFYRLLIESCPGPVLDLGCGTGRILVPLAEDGVEVVGLDSSEAMLALCREKLGRAGANAQVATGDMRRFQADRKFATILIPGFSFQMLVDRDDQLACLETCRGHLIPGGQLVAPMYFPWEMLECAEDAQSMERRKEAARDNGERYVAWQGWAIDRDAQVLTLENRFQRLGKTGAVLEENNRSMSLRWEMPYDMQCLLQEAGFLDVESYGDFEMAPPEPRSESIVYVARA